MRVRRLTNLAFILAICLVLPCSPALMAQANDRAALMLAVPVLAAKLAVGGFTLALIETLSAKMRIFRVPEFLATAFLLGVLALLVHLLLGA